MRPAAVFFYMAVGLAFAQQEDVARPATAKESHSQEPGEPLYRITVISRTTKAVNYGHLTEPTKIGFRGTVLMPDARGEARVVSRRGAVEIEAKVNRLLPPTRFGPQYLTYVLWAITPEGRPVNLGELVSDPDNKAKLKVSSDLQAFALIVTAEPYYAVAQPSGVVVLENVVEPATAGKIEELDAKYELLPRGHFTYNAAVPPPAAEAPAVSMAEYEAVLSVYQAQNAIQIAKAAGAGQYAADTLEKAEQLYQQAVELQTQKSSSRQVVTAAREAAQTAEDARAISAKRQRSSGDRSAPPPRSGADQ